MKIKNSISSVKIRNPNNYLCIKKGKIFIRNKHNRKYKVRQG